MTIQSEIQALECADCATAIREQQLPGAEIAVVLSNKRDAPGLVSAQAGTVYQRVRGVFSGR